MFFDGFPQKTNHLLRATMPNCSEKILAISPKLATLASGQILLMMHRQTHRCRDNQHTWQISSCQLPCNNNNIFICTTKAQSIQHHKKNLKHEKTKKIIHVDYPVHKHSSKSRSSVLSNPAITFLKPNCDLTVLRYVVRFCVLARSRLLSIVEVLHSGMA